MDKAFIKNPVEAYEKLKEENKSLKESLKLISQTLNHTLQSEVDLYKRQIDNSVPNDWEYEEVLVLVEEYIARLKKENEELKIYIESNEQQVKEVETLVMDNDRLINEIDKLKQALTEIKEILNNKNWSCGKKHTTCELKNECAESVRVEILQKISEVIDER